MAKVRRIWSGDAEGPSDEEEVRRWIVPPKRMVEAARIWAGGAGFLLYNMCMSQDPTEFGLVFVFLNAPGMSYVTLGPNDYG